MMLFLMKFSSESEFTSQGIAMHPDVSYTPYDKSSRKKTGNIITSAQFEEVHFYLKLVTM